MDERLAALEKRIADLEFALDAQRKNASMASANRCPRCGCGRVVRSDAMVVAKTDTGPQPVSFSYEGTWIRDPVGAIQPWLCTDCGHVELQVDPAHVEKFLGELLAKDRVEVWESDDGPPNAPYR